MDPGRGRGRKKRKLRRAFTQNLLLGISLCRKHAPPLAS